MATSRLKSDLVAKETLTLKHKGEETRRFGFLSKKQRVDENEKIMDIF